ncbi:cytochrome ubiquinol oxidase subunit I [Chitinimonas lacunae]|uniref:Cytochrome ubiquinol oxidase subunit I n=1 Tax=Chitinimonas lacunae TaxID=1963018 RepID=A0ABV8MM10_9NEIS
MSFDPFILSRLQFAANISFHILFPTITIGLAWVLVYFKLRYRHSGEERWMLAYGFWVKVFALSFGLGVVSGVTMSFQFGTNWPGFMDFAGNIAGPLLAYEVLTAFFLEATFLGIMLFGSRRVSPAVHTGATILVAVGTTLSAFWILALNSWMQTPAGYALIDGRLHGVDWLAVIFNPSFPYRLVHTLIASGLTVAFLLAGISAYRWLRGDRCLEMAAGLRTGVYLAAMLIPLQIIAGDLHGLNTLRHQPAKIAAMEGIWTTGRGVPAVLFGWPDEIEKKTYGEVAIPRLGSFYLTHDFEGEVQGIDAFPDLHPPVLPVFLAFRVMVGTGVLMLLVSWLAAWNLIRRASLPTWLARVLVAMTFSGWIALLAGWYVTEIGRQPWLISGLLLTRDAVSNVPGEMVGLSLAGYVGLYGFLLLSYISVLFYLARRASDYPPPAEPPAAETPQPLIPDDSKEPRHG